MTDRTRFLVVMLDAEYRVDDAEEIVNAISMIKCVANVQTKVLDWETRSAAEMAKFDLRRQLDEFLRPHK